MFKKVAIVGGTHGNEYTGVYLVKHLEKHPEKLNKFSYEIQTYIGNPEAYKANKRFLEEDLNRSFVDKNLKDQPESLEGKRAREMQEILRDKEAVDFLIDLHTTTSNMGKTVVLSKTDVLTHACCQYLSEKMPDIKIIDDERVNEESYFVNKIAPAGILIEVGPTPQGVLRADAYNGTSEILDHILDFLELVKIGKLELKESICEYDFERYKELETIEYPVDENGELAGIIHSELQDKDFELIKSGDPLFQLFSGEVIRYDGEPFYPIFVNEGAYYPKKLAFTKTIIKKD
ncbi:MAG: aspartoacylase [Bacteriovoracaceae bacterium]